jgi:hypothetical protein
LFTVGDGAVKTKEYADGSSEDRGSLDPATRGMLAEDYKPPSIEDMDQWDLMAIEEGKEPEASAEDRAKIGTYASRPATEALRDYIRRFETLEWVPAFVEGDSAVSGFADGFLISRILFTDLSLADRISTQYIQRTIFSSWLALKL